MQVSKWIAALVNSLRRMDHYEVHLFIIKAVFLAWMILESVHALIERFHELFGRVA
jgi:hypothetical protein